MGPGGAPGNAIGAIGLEGGGGWVQGPSLGIDRVDGVRAPGASDTLGVRDITAQMLERLRGLRALNDDLDDLRALAGSVDGVIDAIESLDGEGADRRLQQLAAEHEALLSELKRLEAALRADQPRSGQTTLARTRAEVESRYQSMVERYYRSLSEQPR